MTRLAVFSLALLALGAAQARADSEICQSINGRTTCVHSTGNVSCTSINGETHCTQLDPNQIEPEPMPAPLPQINGPEITVPGVNIRRDGDRLHVQAGDTDVVVGQ